MANGYWNKVLHVNLTDRSTWIEEPGDEIYRRLVGGRGFIARYLLQYVPEGADPLSPENVLIFAPGVMTGVPLPGAGRHSVGAKSPLTGGFGESESGGFWGAELKKAGWDGIVVHGASETPVYLWINEDNVEFREAVHLWGMTTGECEEAIVAEIGDPRIRTAQIGPGGENLVRYANINNDLNEVAGRTGLGAVMGSKKLKAIAVRGTQKVSMAEPQRVTAIAKWVASTLEEKHKAFHEFGTGAAMVGKHLQGGLPTMNYQYGEFDPVSEIDAVAVRDKLRIAMKSCYSCSVRCKKVVRVEARQENAVDAKGRPVAVDPKGRWSIDPKYGGPEYETLAAFGNTLGIDDLIAICKSNEMVNALGLDSISTGTTIAWAVECYERGILTDADTMGESLRFGNAEMVIEMIRKIAYREGIGDLLAEGSQRAAARIGRGSDEFLTTIKGMEMAMHDPRHMPEMRASYLLAPTGGDHMRQTGDRNAFRNQAGLCFFLNYDDEQVLDALQGVTGWDIDTGGRGDGRAPRPGDGAAVQH
ncbi:MAG TPA: aldehyde ferredoxin oxidoreductase N-terminal domain-containing protein, partial [Dehalococcoidia bacterium]